MATTTPNFGWPVPTSTDLVKDGATAIEGLGDAIDASLLDLKGGTSGQVLAKNSNTDMDFTWVAQDDSNAIQNAIVDAKGDLIAATAADTPARLGVGTNGQVLTADSTAATGLAWTTPATSGFVGCSLYKSGTQTISNSTVTAVTFNAEYFDSDGFHSNTTNNTRITIPSGKAGKYLVTAHTFFDSGATGGRQSSVDLNGTTRISNVEIVPQAARGVCTVQAFTYNFSVGDYIELAAWQNSGGNITLLDGANPTLFSVTYLGA